MAGEGWRRLFGASGVVAALSLPATLMLACGGMTAPPVPAVTTVQEPWEGDPRAVMAAIDDRVGAIETLAAECRLSFHRPGKDSVSLQGALVAQPPDRLRLRAWKLGHAVMDLTVRPDGVWLWNAKRADEATRKLIDGELSTGPWKSVWPRLGSLLAESDAAISRSGPNRFVVRGDLPDGGHIEAEIDGPSRTVLAYRLFEPTGEGLGVLELGDYRIIADEPWPRRLEAKTERGTLEVTFHELTLDEPLPESAFEPPKRATRRD